MGISTPGESQFVFDAKTLPKAKFPGGLVLTGLTRKEVVGARPTLVRDNVQKWHRPKATKGIMCSETIYPSDETITSHK
jgi:hypothetical protein